MGRVHEKVFLKWGTFCTTDENLRKRKDAKKMEPNEYQKLCMQNGKLGMLKY